MLLIDIINHTSPTTAFLRVYRRDGKLVTGSSFQDSPSLGNGDALASVRVDMLQNLIRASIDHIVLPACVPGTPGESAGDATPN